MRGSDTPPREDEDRPGLFARFTPRARQALVHAQVVAKDRRHSHVDTEHVLVGILDEGGNLALRVLESLDLELDDVRDELVASMAPRGRTRVSHPPFSALAKRALEVTTKEAFTLGHNYVGCEHLLLGLLATEDGVASGVLRRMGLELRVTRRAVTAALADVVHGDSRPAAATPSASVEATLAEILRRLDEIEERLSAAS